VSVYAKTGDLTVQEIRDLIREFTMKDITFALACMNTDNVSKEVVLEAVNESLKDKPATDRLLVIYRLLGEEINVKQAEMLLHDALKELENKFDPMDAANMRIIAERLGFVEIAGMFKALAEKAREEERKEKEILEKEAKEKVEGIRKEFSNLPVLIDYKLVGREVKVKVRLRKALEKEAFKKYVETCKRLGMSFDSKSKTWGVYIKLA
jgi:chorismate mutase